MKRITGLVLLCCVLLTSCLNTFYPVYEPEDMVTPASITGTWASGNGILRFEPFPPGHQLPGELDVYKSKLLLLTETDNEGMVVSRDIAALVKLGPWYFLDLFPSTTPEEQNFDSRYLSLFIRQHAVYRVDSLSTGQTIALQRVSDKKLTEEIERKKIRIRMVSRDDASLVLATTAELRQHILKYGGDATFYESDKNEVYHRTK